MEAVEAVKTHQPDVVFASWIPYLDKGIDYEIACMGIPMLIVGEGWGGCTGSKKFWGPYSHDDDDVSRPYQIAYMYDCCPEFRDVPSWDGIHDHTYCVIPEHSKPSDFFNLEAPSSSG